METFTITQEAQNGGSVCSFTHNQQRRLCSSQDCQGNWSSVCDVNGMKEYTITSDSLYGGLDCEANDGEQRRFCAPQNCQGSWSACRPNLPKTYSITAPALYGGTECEYDHGDTAYDNSDDCYLEQNLTWCTKNLELLQNSNRTCELGHNLQTSGEGEGFNPCRIVSPSTGAIPPCIPNTNTSKPWKFGNFGSTDWMQSGDHFMVFRLAPHQQDYTNTDRKIITNLKYTTLHVAGDNLDFYVSDNNDPNDISNDTVCKIGVRNADSSFDISPKDINIQCDNVGAGSYLKIKKDDGFIAISDLKVYGFDVSNNIIQPTVSQTPQVTQRNDYTIYGCTDPSYSNYETYATEHPDFKCENDYNHFRL
tara:strand:+ start:97 stop:1188 length:1092 start_codon:yes stop_codon:yes gene_type:complete